MKFYAFTTQERIRTLINIDSIETIQPSNDGSYIAFKSGNTGLAIKEGFNEVVRIIEGLENI